MCSVQGVSRKAKTKKAYQNQQMVSWQNRNPSKTTALWSRITASGWAFSENVTMLSPQTAMVLMLELCTSR